MSMSQYPWYDSEQGVTAQPEYKWMVSSDECDRIWRSRTTPAKMALAQYYLTGIVLLYSSSSSSITILRTIRYSCFTVSCGYGPTANFSGNSTLSDFAKLCMDCT
jgi:hypothetical protein